jgi:hypothetical protein
MKYLAFLVSACAMSIAASGQSPCGLLGHSLDERLLSGLEQFNSLEAIPQRLQKRARPVPNL